ncbi:MAG: type II secretion system protein GspE [Rhodospirillaceae bacterium]|nr:MAG: type II secretion system protein GspE [Rhodospirillaceae bacterium]
MKSLKKTAGTTGTTKGPKRKRTPKKKNPAPVLEQLDATLAMGEDETHVADKDEDETIIILPESESDVTDQTVVVKDLNKNQNDDDATVITKPKRTRRSKKKVATSVKTQNQTAVSNPKKDPSLHRLSKRSAPLNSMSDLLVSEQLLDDLAAERIARSALAHRHTFFRTLADDQGLQSKKDVYAFIAKKFNYTLITDEDWLRKEAIETDWLNFSQVETWGAIVLADSTSTKIVYATIDPFDISLNDWIKKCSGADETEIVLVFPDVFTVVSHQLKTQQVEEEGEVGISIDISVDQEMAIQNNIDNVDIPQIVNYMIHRGYIQGASDIHIEPTEEMLLVRNRVDGILHDDTTLPRSLHPEISSRIKIISSMDVAERRRPQDGRIGAVIRDAPIDIRVSSFPTVYGEKIVMRLLDKNALRPSPESLGLLPRDLRLLKDKINSPYGLVMISGPTGSGKTTTLYSCLGSIDKNSKNVLTVEDPVEYRLKGVHQMQVNEKIDLTFESGLRTILRQDPDVVMVGECRDKETASMAIQASLTGHIVFSTIHTNDAIGVVTRLLDMGIDPFLVANSLTLAIAQRLVRSICTRCKVEVTGDDVRQRLKDDGVSAERLDSLGIKIDDNLTYLEGTGCLHCRNTGYLGRHPVFEVFEMTNEARTLIMSPDFNADKLRNMVMAAGMTTLIRHGVHLIEDGITTYEEVIRVLGESY